MIKLGIVGVCGKMGRRVFELASQIKDFEITLALERKGTPAIGRDIGKLKISSSPDGLFLTDVVIDFSSPDASELNLDYIAKYKKPLVLGTTGFGPAGLKKVEDISQVVPVVFSPNMSVGVNVLFLLTTELAKRLGPEYLIEIVESHHAAKKDAPSGTAKKFVQNLSKVTGKEIPTHSLRMGDIIGDHTIVYCGNSERIEITHRAHNRDPFALGALKAARWILNKPAALYSMEDVLKIS